MMYYRRFQWTYHTQCHACNKEVFHIYEFKFSPDYREEISYCLCESCYKLLCMSHHNFEFIQSTETGGIPDQRLVVMEQIIKSFVGEEPTNV